MIARFGSINKTDPNEPNRQERFVSDWIVHPNYNPREKKNDIAILKLKESINMSNPTYVYPACLDTRSGRFEEYQGTACGFGVNECRYILLVLANFTVT